jgi:excisionase family DNA binding protein
LSTLFFSNISKPPDSLRHVLRSKSVIMSVPVGGSKMLDKKQAAEYLGVTTRTLERHTKEGKISVRYENGKFGDVALFDPEELAAFKDNQQTPHIKPAIIEEEPQQVNTPTNLRNQITYQPQNEILSSQQPEPNFGIGALMAPLGALFSNLTRAIDNHGSRITASELRNKLLLTIDEAQILTGLSRDILLTAIKNDELPSKIMGKSYRIKTQDLEKYITELEF